jgi:hypothetical protein
MAHCTRARDNAGGYVRHSTLICLLLLATLLFGGVGIAPAQLADAPVLARVEWSGAPVPTLPVYALIRDAAARDYALVLAPLNHLRQSGARYRVLDANGARPEDYVIARERRAGARTQAARQLAVLDDDGRQIVVRLPFAQADALAALGFSLRRLDTPLVFRAPPLPRVSQAAFPDPTVAAMIAQVQSNAVSNYTAQLSGEVPATIGGAPYTIASRHTRSGTPIQKATQYVYERMQALGLAVSYHNWSACGLSNRNVVAEKIGLTRPNESVLVVAHLDDLPWGSSAPGADDNASGSVGVWLAAEILRQYHFERTLRFVFFTGEEQGMCGSSRYAASLSGQSVIAVYNMDMLAWNAIDGPTLRLHTRAPSQPGHSGDLAIANTFVNVVSAYGLSSHLSPIVDSDGAGESDHVSFWNQGWSSILAIEDDYDDFNTNYHTTGDRLSQLDLVYFTSFVKASVGTVAHLALPLSEAGSVRGTISDAATLLPIPNAAVQATGGASPALTQTDASGTYTFSLPAGTYTMTASASRYLAQTVSGVVVSATITTTRDLLLSPAPHILFAPIINQRAP